MKKFENYFSKLLIILFSIIFFSCTKNDELVTNKTQTKSPVVFGATICDITGPSITTPDTSIVTPDTSTNYSYTNNTGIPNTIVWEVKSANPMGSIILSGDGATITATFSSNFTSGEITAFGKNGNAQDCSSLLKITKK